MESRVWYACWVSSHRQVRWEGKLVVPVCSTSWSAFTLRPRWVKACSFASSQAVVLLVSPRGAQVVTCTTMASDTTGSGDMLRDSAWASLPVLRLNAMTRRRSVVERKRVCIVSSLKGCGCGAGG